MVASNQKRGAEWEQVLSDSFDELACCTVKKTTAPVRVVRFGNAGAKGRNRGEFTGYFEEKGTNDFEGGYRGIVVSVEAKRTVTKRWQYGAIAPHQKDRMTLTAKQGGLAGVLLAWDHIEGSTIFFAVPWWTIQGWLDAGKASVAPHVLMSLCDDEAMGVKMLRTRGIFGFNRFLVELEPFLDLLIRHRGVQS